MGNNYEFDFFGGEYPWPAAPGIAEVFGERQIYYSYFDESEGSVKRDALNDLAQYVADNGPFHAILGVSLGAALAATLLLRDERQQAEIHNAEDDKGKNNPRFSCAVFLCGTLPCDWNSLLTGEMRLLQAKDVRYPIQIPTVHAWSQYDVGYPTQSQQLVLMCDPKQRVEILHGTGHGVPSQVDELVAIA